MPSERDAGRVCLCCGDEFNKKYIYETEDYAEIVKEELEGDACFRLLNDGRTEFFNHV